MSGSANTHSRLSPSAASRWTECTASVSFCAQHGLEGKSSDYSNEGTLAHDIAEQVLLGHRTDYPEGFEQLSDYVDLCRTLQNRWGGHVLVEEQVPLYYKPEDYGTVDFGLLADSAIAIVDLKWGAGIPVSPEWNKQLAIYCRSLIETYQDLYQYDADTPVIICISQPRCADPEAGGIWNTTLAELEEFTNDIRDKAEEVMTGTNLQFKPSVSVCRWCPGKQHAKCPHRVTKAFGLLAPQSENVLELLPVLDSDPPAIFENPETVTLLSDEHILGIYARIPEINAVVKSVEDAVLARALAGNAVPGTKLVQGRAGNSAWNDEALALKKLKTLLPAGDVTEKTIKSPAQILKLPQVKADEKLEEKIRAMTGRSQGKLKVALESDKRPSVVPSVELLDILPEETEE